MANVHLQARSEVEGTQAAPLEVPVCRTIVHACGLFAALLFVIVGVGYDLELFADGSLFSYGIAAQDAWAFHWHNISTRVAVYLFAHVPSETYVAVTGDARGGIVLYGFLFFIGPLLGLASTYLIDTSPRRLFFTFACVATACLCPLVFGFPTEMWIGHSVFWPTLALAYCGIRRLPTALALLAGFAILMLTHESGVVFAFSIISLLSLRGLSDPLFKRGVVVSLIALAVWLAVRSLMPPDAYYAAIIPRGALTLFDVTNLTRDSAFVLEVVLFGYLALLIAGRRFLSGLWGFVPEIVAATVCAAGLFVYWLWFDDSLQAQSRYPLRSVLLLGVPLLGAHAAILTMLDDGDPKLFGPTLPRILGALARRLVPSAVMGISMLALIVLVHTVETTKFVNAWQVYTSAVRKLAMADGTEVGTASIRSASDTKKYGPHFSDSDLISSELIPDQINRLSWYSTTQYLSILVAQGFRPRRLVVDPDAGYFWLSCSTAKHSEAASRSIPKASRALIRAHSCLNRPE